MPQQTPKCHILDLRPVPIAWFPIAWYIRKDRRIERDSQRWFVTRKVLQGSHNRRRRDGLAHAGGIEPPVCRHGCRGQGRGSRDRSGCDAIHELALGIADRQFKADDRGWISVFQGIGYSAYKSAYTER